MSCLVFGYSIVNYLYAIFSGFFTSVGGGGGSCFSVIDYS